MFSRVSVLFRDIPKTLQDIGITRRAAIQMLRLAKDLNGFTLEGRDGEIGTVKEFYFDDKSWDYSLPDRQHRKLDDRSKRPHIAICAR